jgi:hypothetical protein
MAPCRTFCYWLTHHEFKKVRSTLGAEGTGLDAETRIPCRTLRRSAEISYVDPKAWKGFCKRRTSWYLKSDKVGKFLVVSQKAIDLPEMGEPILITESTFKPERLPSSKEIAKLVQSRRYQRRRPRAWEKVDPFEKESYRRSFEHCQPNSPFDFDEIFLCHSANHANFVDPKFFVLKNGLKAPYSIFDSLHVCSSCLEFFDLVGDQWPLKFVVPCLGAVQFAHLPQNRYFKVEKENP